MLAKMTVARIVAKSNLTDKQRDLVLAYLEVGSWAGAGRALGLKEDAMKDRRRRLLKKLRTIGRG